MTYPKSSHPKFVMTAILVFVLGVSTLGSGCQFSTSFPQMPWKRTQVEPPVVGPPTFSTFVSPLFASARPRRIVMIESGKSAGSYDPTRRMITELASQIRAARLFEVVTPEVRLESHMDNILNGKFNEIEVSQLARQYNADAVAFVRVNELRGFAPMRVSATIALVDSNETIVIFAVDGIWDTANAATQQAFASHVGSGSDLVSKASDIQLQSPRALLEFASSQVAESLRNSMR